MNNSRRSFIKSIALGTAAAYITLPSCKASLSATKLTILHTNDIHSHIDPFPADHSKYPNQGGYARRATLVKQIRREEEHVLVLDSGDIFQGTPYFNFYKGELDIKLMNQIQYDASTIGNHEFDNGIDSLGTQLKLADFAFVNANYSFSDTPLEQIMRPYKIFEKGPLKIGVIGLGIELEGLVNKVQYGDVKYNDPITTGDSTARFLKEEKSCDLVIALSHLGYEYKTDKVSDIVLAQNTKYIDLILGGHTHTFLKEPTFITNKANSKVLINQTGWAGINLGRIDIAFNNGGSSIINHSQL